MKALALLPWIGQIKTGAWADVIYVPSGAAIVVPIHAIGELCLQVLAEFFDGAANEICRWLRLAGATAQDGTINATFDVEADGPVCFQVSLLLSMKVIDGLLLRSELRIGSIANAECLAVILQPILIALAPSLGCLQS